MDNARFPLEGEQGGGHDYEHQDEPGNDFPCAHLHGNFVQGLEIGGRYRIFQEFLPAHEEQSDQGESDYDTGLDGTMGTGEAGLETVGEVGYRKILPLVVQAHDAETCYGIHQAGDKSEWPDKECPVVAGDDNDDQEQHKHDGAVEQGAAIPSGFAGFVGNGLEDRGSHHHKQQGQPEQRHAGGTEILDARQNIVPELE